MPLNSYITLGKSGLRVSPFCLGTMTFGNDWGWGSSVQDSQAILDYFIESGGNFIDTANNYTRGHAEVIIGDHIGKHSSKRDRVVIATKFFGSMYSGDPNGGGANRKAMISQCEQSLRRLQTDYIDLYWLHCFDKYTPIEETMKALNDLVTSGKVRYIGFSNTPAWVVAEAQMLAKFRGWAPLAAIQVEYSLLERTIEGELIPAADRFGLGVIPWSPLKFGILTGKHTRETTKNNIPGRGQVITSALNDKAYDIIDELMRIAEELNTTSAKIALAWVQSQRSVTSTIIGARTIKQLQENLSALDLALRKEDIQTLNDLSKPTLNFPYDHINFAGPVGHGGVTINSETHNIWELAPKNDNERY